MTDDQRSISAAFALVFGAMAVKHGWLGKAQSWARSPATAGARPPMKLGSKLTDWQAGLAVYALLMLAGESANFGPPAAAVAWAVGLVEGAAALPTIAGKFPGTFTSSTAGSGPAGATNGSQPGTTAPVITPPGGQSTNV